MKILLLDPSLEPQNAGDQIIIKAILRELNSSDIQIIGSVPTHARLTKSDIALVNEADLCIVGGTNLLVSKFYRQWNLGFREIFAYRNKCVLFGVGWWQYQKTPSFLMKLVYRIILNRSVFHSVRDTYTKNMLTSLNLQILNTSCPTLWQIPKQVSPQTSEEKCIVTLTDYSKNSEIDLFMLNLAAETFKKVFFWPQGSGDLEYLRSLNFHCEILPRNLAQLDELLENGACYFGTRLHAGIRALSFGNPTLIVAVDNRATEISKDTGITVLPREDVTKITRLSLEFHPPILPLHEIEIYRDQLKRWA